MLYYADIKLMKKYSFNNRFTDNSRYQLIALPDWVANHQILVLQNHYICSYSNVDKKSTQKRIVLFRNKIILYLFHKIGFDRWKSIKFDRGVA
jgi:hypothetical protein